MPTTSATQSVAEENKTAKRSFEEAQKDAKDALKEAEDAQEGWSKEEETRKTAEMIDVVMSTPQAQMMMEARKDEAKKNTPWKPEAEIQEKSEEKEQRNG